jgi:hypothetical protein
VASGIMGPIVGAEGQVTILKVLRNLALQQ